MPLKCMNVRVCCRERHLEVHQWAQAQGCPNHESTRAKPAENRNLDVLKCARAHRCPWDERTCAIFLKYRHLKVLRWEQANGWSRDETFFKSDLHK